MGCDIHATIEANKWKSPDREDMWFGLARDIDIERWYSLFGYLAGVRSDEKPLVEPRGVPKDMSFEFRQEYEEWDSDAHTASWLLFSELEALPEQFKEEYFYKCMEIAANKYGKDNVRLVFFFDN